MSHPHPYPYPQMPLSIASDGSLALHYCVRYQVFVHVCMYVCPSTFHCCNGLDDCEAQHQHIGSSSFSDLVYADDTVFFVKDATVAPTLAIDPSCLNLRPFRTRQTNSTAGVRSNQNSDTILVSFYRAMLCIRGTSHGPVSVCLSVCPSFTSQCSTKTAKRRITQTTPHDSPGNLVY